MKMGVLIRLVMAAALGVAAALLVSCGTSGKGLIPLANAGPLRSDFEAVASAAQAGGGQCAATITALEKTESDFRSLPQSVDQRLHSRLEEGIRKLRGKALALCEQPSSTATSTTNTKSVPTTTTQSTPTTTTQSTPTTTTTTTTTTTPPAPGGGTQAPGEHEEETPAGPGVGKGGEPPGHERNDGGTGGPSGPGGQGGENSLRTK